VKTLSLLLTLILLTLFCTGPVEIAGGRGGSETTNGVYAVITYSDGTPAAGSTVRMRKADYVSLTADSRFMINDLMTTDSQGYFMIDSIALGSYYIEVSDNRANSSQGGAVLFKFTIVNDRDTLDLGKETLRPFASLLGEIDSMTAGRRLFVQIRGLERFTEVAQDGTFAFDDLPAGTHCVRIVDAGFALVKEIENVKTSSGDTLSVKVTVNSKFSSLIQINTAAAGLSSFSVIENFPLLIRLESPAFDFSAADSAGNDIRFSKPNGQNLPYEIEEWDSFLGEAAVWVLMDSIRGGVSDQFIVMSWGEPEAPYLSDGAAVFHSDFGFSGVWHFNEDPSAGSGAVRNRSANDFHGTPSSSMTSANLVSGVVGGALMFDGEEDNIRAGLLDLSGNYTLSCWIKMEHQDGIHTNWRFIIKEPAYTLWYDNDDRRWGGFRAEHYAYIPDADSSRWVGIYQDSENSHPNHTAEFGVWSHIAATWDGEKIRLFINGEAVDSTVALDDIGQPPLPSERQLLFGGRTDERFKGIMDEVRIEHVARSTEWIRLNYETQRKGSTIVRYQR